MGNLLKMLIINAIQIYAGIFILRSFLYFSKMPSSHSIAALCIRLTQPLIKPIQQYFPCKFGFETASLFIAFLLAGIDIFMCTIWLTKLRFSSPVFVANMMMIVFVWLKYICYVYFGLIIVNIILKLFEPNGTTGFYIDKILAPFTKPFRRLRIGMIDFSILPLFMLTQFYINAAYPMLREALFSLVL